jgi:GAF domain-containing protein
MSADIQLLTSRYERDHRYLELLVRSGDILSRALDWHETVAAVCQAAVETVADICVLELAEDGELYLAASAHRDPSRANELKSAAEMAAKTRDSNDPAAIVSRSGQPLLAPIVDDAFVKSHSSSLQQRNLMQRMGYRSLMIIPVVSKTQGVLGALTLALADSNQEPYDEEVLRFSQDLGKRCGTAIAKAQLYQQTLNIANRFQQAALPHKLPKHAGISFDAFYEPSSEELLVGGDWYDAFDLPDGRIAITIGDVLGHGLDAAVWMSRHRNGFRAALLADPDPVRALVIADQMIHVEGRDEFTTALVALLDPVRHTLTCATAGHPGPLVWDRSGRVIDPFAERGLPLGLFELATIGKTAESLSLPPGSFAAFFTDGLLEWNRNIEEAWERLKRAIMRQDVREALHPATAVFQSVTDRKTHQDDVAILTIRYDHW